MPEIYIQNWQITTRMCWIPVQWDTWTPNAQSVSTPPFFDKTPRLMVAMTFRWRAVVRLGKKKQRWQHAFWAIDYKHLKILNLHFVGMTLGNSLTFSPPFFPRWPWRVWSLWFDTFGPRNHWKSKWVWFLIGTIVQQCWCGKSDVVSVIFWSKPKDFEDLNTSMPNHTSLQAIVQGT